MQAVEEHIREDGELTDENQDAPEDQSGTAPGSGQGSGGDSPAANETGEPSSDDLGPDPKLRLPSTIKDIGYFM
jgi:hypothetical protein